MDRYGAEALAEPVKLRRLSMNRSVFWNNRPIIIIDKVKRKVEPIRKAFPFLSSPLWKISSASAELIIRTKKRFHY